MLCLVVFTVIVTAVAKENYAVVNSTCKKADNIRLCQCNRHLETTQALRQTQVTSADKVAS